MLSDKNHTKLNKISLAGLSKGLLIISLALIFFMSNFEPIQAQKTNRIAAIVNDKVISTFDLQERIQLIIFSAGLPNNDNQKRLLAPQVLRDLIDETLQSEEAERLNIRITNKEMSSALSRIERSNNIPQGGFNNTMKSNSISAKAALNQIRASIIWQKFIGRRVVPTIEISEEEVDKVIKRIHSVKGKIQYHINEVLLPVDEISQKQTISDLANRLVKQIRNGTDITKIARQFSTSASAAIGGDIGWIQEGELNDKANRAINKLKVGAVTNPILTQDGYLILQIKNKRQLKSIEKEDAIVSLRQIIKTIDQNASEDYLNSEIKEIEESLKNVVGCRQFNKIAKKIGTPQPRKPSQYRLGDLNESLRLIAAKIKKGVPSKTLMNKNNIQVIMVCERQNSEDLERNKIRNTLLRQRIDMLSRRYLRDLRQSAFIDLRI
jgi:peptidyl-prolyl cis-trans isomerase SurA